jgi:hypothetical protein
MKLKTLLYLLLFLPGVMLGQTITVGGNAGGGTSLDTTNALYSRHQLQTEGLSTVDFRNLVNFPDSLKALTGIGNTRVVAKSGGSYSTIQSAINAANSGDIVYVFPGLYTENIALKNGVDIIGIGQNVVLRGTNSSTYVVIADGDTCDIINITVIYPTTYSYHNLFSCSNLSFITFRDIVFTGTSTAGTILIDSSMVKAVNCDLNLMGIVTIKDYSNVVWDANFWRCPSNTITNGSNVDLKIRNYYGGSLIIGSENPYNSNIKGTSSSYKSILSTGYSDWYNYNLLGNCVVNLEVKNIENTAFSSSNTHTPNIAIHQNNKLTINNTNGLINNDLASTPGGFCLFVHNSAEVRVYNSSIKQIDGLNGDFKIYLKNTLVHYDGDLAPWNGNGSIYTSTNFPTYYGGSHCIELTPIFNKDIIPTLSCDNTTIEHMGMDVLNSMVDTVALKNLQVNLSYRSATTANPSNPTITGAKWATGQSYTAGQVVMSYNSSLGDTVGMLIITNHTSGSLETDYDANKIRILYGARIQNDGSGKYEVLYYGGGRVWKSAYKFGQYHGGKYFSRGNAYSGTANLILKNTEIINHAAIWAWHEGAAPAITWQSDGLLTYNNFGTFGAEYNYFDNVSFNIFGEHGSFKYLGPNFQQSSRYDESRINIKNISIGGENLSYGMLFYADSMAVKRTSVKIDGNISYVGSNTATTGTQLVSGSNALIGTSTSAYPTGITTFTQWADSCVSFSGSNINFIQKTATLNATTGNITNAVLTNTSNAYGLQSYYGYGSAVTATGGANDTLLITITHSSITSGASAITGNGYCDLECELVRTGNSNTSARFRLNIRMSRETAVYGTAVVNTSIGGTATQPTAGVYSASSTQTVIWVKNAAAYDVYPHIRLTGGIWITGISLSNI